LPIKVALLKGRSNYLCLHRIEQFWKEDDLLDKKLNQQVAEVRRLAPQTQFGETGEINTISEKARVWPYVTSTTDNCLGKDCPLYDNCYLFKARRRAMEADVVVINHHLFFADLSLKEKGVARLLPKVETFILDEAHQLPEIASHFFTTRISSRQLLLLLSDIEMEWKGSAQDPAQVSNMIGRLKVALQQFRKALGEKGQKRPWADKKNDKSLLAAREQLLSEMEFLTKLLQKNAAISKGLEACWERCIAYQANFSILTLAEQVDQIYWFETTHQGFVIHATPLHITQQFRDIIENNDASWVFTSATLSVANSLQHYLETMGLQQAETLQLTSPFDYAKQGLLYLPRYLPDPNHVDYIPSLIAISLPIIDAAQGRTFILCTSYSAMLQAADLLQGKLA